MTDLLPVYPFEGGRAIGTVIEVGPSAAKLNLPYAAASSGQWLHGHKLGAGEVGEFVFLECGEFAILGRLVSIKLPEKERLSVEPELGAEAETHPVGVVQLLATVGLRSGVVTSGISNYPRLGTRAYSAHPKLIKWIAEASQANQGQLSPVILGLGILPTTTDTSVNFTPERLFGRHCAVLGATGGGKSWTVARLIEQAGRHSCKLVLFDATGEFYTLSGDGVSHLQIGPGAHMPEKSEEVVIPYSSMKEGDLFALFKPSGQVQGPKLRLAMKSLKLARLEVNLAATGLLKKAEQPRAPFEAAYTKNAAALEKANADFDIKFLARQISEECVWPSGGTFNQPDHTRWGKYNDQEKSYCLSLITRIEDMLGSKELACIFDIEKQTSFATALDKFLDDPNSRVLRISLRYLAFEHNAREIVANAIGRLLLERARASAFRERPLLLFLDEAHQFLNKQLGDENTRYSLDSFELIAKEGRKFSLNICISTQRPRDIPEGVLSQMGTLIVHRLTNDGDREVVERASGDIDRSAAAFLPTLSPGEAVIIGVDFPMPLTIQVEQPAQRPDSRGPNFQRFWQAKKEIVATRAAAKADVPGLKATTKK